MSAVPDPLWNLAVGSTSAAWGSLVASPLESPDSSLRLPTPRSYTPDRKAKEGEEEESASSFGLQLGLYDALLSLSHTSADAALIGQVFRAIVVGVACTPLEIWDLARSSQKLRDGDMDDAFWHIWFYQGLWQACALQSILFLVICLPLHQALIEYDGWQPYAAGALAGVIASLVSHPLGIVQQRLSYQCSMDYQVDQSFPVQVSSTGLQQEAQQKEDRPVRGRLQDQNTQLTTMVVDGAPFILRKVLPPPPKGFTNSTVFFKRGQSPQGQQASSNSNLGSGGQIGGGSWNDAVPVQPLPENSMMVGGAYYGEEEEDVVWGDLSPSSHQERGNPIAVMMGEIVQEEGPTALFSGALRQCIIAIPKFGSALALHHALQEVLLKAGWITQTMSQP